jgi:hypothetical protein
MKRAHRDIELGRRIGLKIRRIRQVFFHLLSYHSSIEPSKRGKGEHQCADHPFMEIIFEIGAIPTSLMRFTKGESACKSEN